MAPTSAGGCAGQRPAERCLGALEVPAFVLSLCAQSCESPSHRAVSAVQVDVRGEVEEVDDEFRRLARDEDEALADGHSFAGPALVDHAHGAAAGDREQGSVARQQAEVSVDTGQAHRAHGSDEDEAFG